MSWTGSPRTIAGGGGARAQVRSEVEALARDALADAPQDALDPCPQLRVVVGLGDVVLGELVEQVGLVVAGVDRRQDDDRQVGPCLDLAGQGQAVHARHQQVDDEEVRPGGVEPAERLVAVARGGHVEAIETKLLGERDEQTAVVVDEQDPWCHVPVGPAARR